MACNDGPNKANNLHTDLEHGLHKRVWNATVDEITNTVSFTCKLVDGELGLPGNRTFTVAYVLQAGPTVPQSSPARKAALPMPTPSST